jgi:hypothetical protein
MSFYMPGHSGGLNVVSAVTAPGLLIHWRKRPYHTTTDFIAHIAEDHDRRAVSAILSRSFPS